MDRAHAGLFGRSFYQTFEFKTTLPGPATLKIQVKDWNRYYPVHELVGETHIDLEDRWFHQKWQSLDQTRVISASFSSRRDTPELAFSKKGSRSGFAVFSSSRVDCIFEKVPKNEVAKYSLENERQTSDAARRSGIGPSARNPLKPIEVRALHKDTSSVVQGQVQLWHAQAASRRFEFENTQTNGRDLLFRRGLDRGLVSRALQLKRRVSSFFSLSHESKSAHVSPCIPPFRLEIRPEAETRREPPEELLGPAKCEFEVRIICWGTQDVPFEMGDYFAEFWIGNSRHQKTDVHWRCRNGKASRDFPAFKFTRARTRRRRDLEALTRNRRDAL